MRWRHVQVGLLLLFCFVLGFNIIIPFFDRRSFASARDATYYYDTLEAGWGNWNDGGTDCARYTGGTYAHEGSCAIDIQDNSGYPASATYSNVILADTNGYDNMTIDFWWRAVSMENGEAFWVNYYDGTASLRLATIVIGTGTYSNNIFYHTVVTISEDDYTFSDTARFRIQCDATDDFDDVYIDQIYINVSRRMWIPSMVEGYFTFKNTDYTPVYDNMSQGYFTFENTSSWQGSDGFFTFDNTPTWKGSEGYFTFGNITAYETIIDGYFNFANTPAWQGVSGYYTFGNTPSWSGVDGYFTFGNTPSWSGEEGYFIFANTPAWSGEEGYFIFANTPAWSGDEGYFTFSNTPSWSGEEGYFTFGNRDYTPIFANMTQGYFTFGNVTTDRTFEEGYFTFENIVSLTIFSEGYFTFANSPSWLGLDGYFTFGNSPSWIGPDGYFTFGNASANQTIEEGWFTFENITSSFRTFDDGWFSFNSSPTWHGDDGWFLFYSVRAWGNISQGWFSFENSVNYTNITQGYFNFSNTPSWRGGEGWNTFGTTTAWTNITHGWNTFSNVSSWVAIEQGWNTFGNASYMVIMDVFPLDGQTICPDCYEITDAWNLTYIPFAVDISQTNGTSMNITWSYNNSGVWTVFGQLINQGNGSHYSVPSWNVTYGHVYQYKIKVSDGVSSIEKVITFSTDTYTVCMITTLSPTQFSCIIMLILFIFLFWIGYVGEKRSAGAFMLISGLVLLGLIAVAFSYLPLGFVALLASVAGFITLLGVNKWLFKPNMSQQKPK